MMSKSASISECALSRSAWRVETGDLYLAEKESRTRGAAAACAASLGRKDTWTALTNATCCFFLVVFPYALLGIHSSLSQQSDSRRKFRQLTYMLRNSLRPALLCRFSLSKPPLACLPSHHLPNRTFTSSSMSSTNSAVYKTFTSSDAPAALGPYSQSVVHNGLAFISGCIPYDAQTMKMVEGGEGDASAEGVIEKQTEQVLKNLFAVLKAAGADKSSVLKTTVFIKDMNLFRRINVIYEKVRDNYLACSSSHTDLHVFGRALLHTSLRGPASKSPDCRSTSASRSSALLPLSTSRTRRHNGTLFSIVAFFLNKSKKSLVMST